jgi:hypothetical protein
VALTSEVTHLKDHNLKLANKAKPTKGKNSGGKPKQAGKGKTPREQLTKKSGLGRKYHPRKGSPSPSKCQILIISTIGVNIIRHGLFIPQLPAQFELTLKNQKQLSLSLQCWKGLNLQSETLSLCPVLLLLVT